MPKRSLEDIYQINDILEQNRQENALERGRAKGYFKSTPTIENIAKGIYHYYKSVPGLGGKNENNIIVGGIAPSPGINNGVNAVKNTNSFRNTLRKIKYVTSKNQLSNFLAYTGDRAINAIEGGVLGYTIGTAPANIFENKLPESVVNSSEYKATKIASGIAGGVLGSIAGFNVLPNLNTGNKLLNDIISRPTETLVETIKRKYPYTRRQSIRNILKEENDIANIYNKNIHELYQGLVINNSKMSTPKVTFRFNDPNSNVSGRYEPLSGTIRLKRTLDNSNLPISYAGPYQDVRNTFAHELRHHIQHNIPNFSYSVYDANYPPYYHIPDFNSNTAHSSFKSLLKNIGKWEGSPSEFDSELSRIQTAMNLKSTQVPKNAITYLSNRFGLSKSDTRSIVKNLIEDRKNFLIGR